MAQSANDSIILPGLGYVVDAAGNVWSITSNEQVAVNGVVDPTTSNVAEIIYVNGLIWRGDGVNWYSKASPADAWSAPTETFPQPATPIPTALVAAASNGGAAPVITDANGNTWQITNGQVVINGVADPTTANVIELAYVNGQVWQENSQGLWWSKSAPSGSWSPTSGTPVNPVTGNFEILNTPGNEAVVNIGVLTSTPNGPGGSIIPLTTTELVTTGVQASNGQLLTVIGAGTLVVDGDSSVTQGANLYVRIGGRPPGQSFGPLENNGAMTVNGATVEAGLLSGSGSIDTSNGSTLRIQTATSGNTIQLSTSNLYIGGEVTNPAEPFGLPGGLSFLAPITMDSSSAITLDATQATSEVVNSLGGSGNEVILYDGTAKVADLDINGPANIYAVNDAQNDRVTLTATNSGSALPITAAPPADPGVSVSDTTTGQPVSPNVQSYSGPVAGLQNQYITSGTTDGLNVTTTTPNWFIATGSGDDAINVAQGGGNNVLDGGAGSNFLTGGSGDDTFFVDDRLATSPIWSTVTGFHTGDAVTVWGVTPQDFTLTWLDGQGAAGNTGLTLSATSANRPDANVTLAGYTSADLNNGKLTVSFGTTPNEPGLAGSTYMQITAT